MIGRELLVHELAGLAELDRIVAAVVRRQFLLDDVCLYRHAEMVRLSGKVGRGVIVDTVLFEILVAEVAPEDGGESEFMCVFERLGNFDDLTI